MRGDEMTTYNNFWRRGAAFWVDFAVLYAFIYGLSMIVSLPEAPVDEATQLWASTWAYLVAPFGMALSVVGVLYDIILVRYFQGTLGKLLFRVKVTTLSGAPLTWGRAMTRSCTHFAHVLLAAVFMDYVIERTGIVKKFLKLEPPSSLTLEENIFVALALLGIAFLTLLFSYTGDWICLFNKKRQTIHDMIAGTVVVRR
jgi:uncharacterized RDD family membrane protein YckC